MHRCSLAVVDEKRDKDDECAPSSTIVGHTDLEVQRTVETRSVLDDAWVQGVLTSWLASETERRFRDIESLKLNDFNLRISHYLLSSTFVYPENARFLKR